MYRYGSSKPQIFVLGNEFDFILSLFQLFYTFYALLSQESYGTFDSMMYSGIYCTVYFIEIYTITRISNTVIDEREKLSTFIHRRAYFDADSRFIQSVSWNESSAFSESENLRNSLQTQIQQLSLKAFCERPAISAMSFFIIDRSLVIGVCLWTLGDEFILQMTHKNWFTDWSHNRDVFSDTRSISIRSHEILC